MFSQHFWKRLFAITITILTTWKRVPFSTKTLNFRSFASSVKGAGLFKHMYKWKKALRFPRTLRGEVNEGRGIQLFQLG